MLCSPLILPRCSKKSSAIVILQYTVQSPGYVQVTVLDSAKNHAGPGRVRLLVQPLVLFWFNSINLMENEMIVILTAHVASSNAQFLTTSTTK